MKKLFICFHIQFTQIEYPIPHNNLRNSWNLYEERTLILIIFCNNLVDVFPEYLYFASRNIIALMTHWWAGKLIFMLILLCFNPSIPAMAVSQSCYILHSGLAVRTKWAIFVACLKCMCKQACRFLYTSAIHAKSKQVTIDNHFLLMVVLYLRYTKIFDA